MDEFTLEQLLEQVTDENIHPEIDTGRAVGNEEWYPVEWVESATPGLQRTDSD